MNTTELEAQWREAQTQRRSVEREISELPGKLELAVKDGDAEQILSLQRRKAELPDLYLIASSKENKLQAELTHLRRPAIQAEIDAAAEAVGQAETALERRQAEVRKELAALDTAVQEARTRHASALRALESEAARYSRAATRFNEAMKAGAAASV
jgi:chromosome segregation ATPase